MPRKGEALSAKSRRKLSKSRKRYFKENPEAYKRASEAKTKRDLKQLLTQNGEITHKRCSKCKQSKPIAEFHARRFFLKCGVISVRPEPDCKECKNRRSRARYNQLKAEGHDPAAAQRERYSRLSTTAKARLRERNRERAATKRREEGRPAKGAYNGNGHAREPRLDAGPLLGLLEEYGHPTSLLGVPNRRLYALYHGEQLHTNLNVVDAVLGALDCPERLHELYPPREEPELVGYQILDPAGVLESVRA